MKGRKRQLYKIREDIEAVLSPPTPADDDDDDDETEPYLSADQIHDQLAELGLEFDDKLENVLAYIKNLKAELESVSTERRKLAGREKALRNKIGSLNAYTLLEIEATERMGVVVGPHKAKVARSRDAVVVVDENLVPDRFVQIETKVLKSDIMKWFKQTGEILPGTDIETNRKHLRVS